MQGGAPAYPPFPPTGAPQGFVPPPFPPNFAPGTSPAGGSASPAGFRPPPGAVPPRPAHPGLGLPPLPQGYPSTPGYGSSPGAPPAFKKDVKTTSVFVGGIAPGITDITLTHLLNACGPLHELKRVSGANGKPQAFGFALYESPEVVMRCLRCLNGIELPDMTPEGRRSGAKKALVVKVDDKTREFLEEFESTLGRTDDEEDGDAICRKSIAHIVALLTDPNAPAPKDFKLNTGGKSPINVVVPAHLQDLKEGDLPEEQRVVVLDQIAIFRENAARREREKQRIGTEKEKMKIAERGSNPQAPSEYGYGGNRGLEQDRQRATRQWGPSPTGQNGTPPTKGHAQGDPQGYDKPVNFVKPETTEGKGDTERTDEEDEELRQHKRDRERDHALRERERRVEQRERQRIENANREISRRRQDEDQEERLRRRQIETFESWDDEEKAERGREYFYADRARWRAQRQSARNREFQDDLRDRHREEEERKQLEIESEEFLRKQAEELAEMEEKQRQRGLLTEDAAPIKLALGTRPEVKEEKKPEIVPKPRVAFEEEDDAEEDPSKRKKRTFVKLDYDEPPRGENISEAERIARRNAKLLEVKRDVPTERRRLWSTRIEWAAVDEALLKNKISPFVRERMKKLLGEVDEDLADYVLEQLREKKGAEDVVEAIEPVFAEDSEPFVIALWRQLVFESFAYSSGIETGNFMA